ncbi:MAG: bifunctional 5,10-methylenetetrahydrofolate dehydrogenase/5,10-methenyltetrahydrofolate cyclohydrolase [Bacilli bacterium]|nr:bifunctional 5,10-methylenetetrahydrofolate dehydrogenase/5,10-methenyltetrahydrofolate cyclohydrolase [Bacilli bacterium]
MTILDGKSIKNKILDELKDEVSNMEEKPNFVVIQVGNNEASNVYIKQKAKMAEYIGYGYTHLKLDEDITEGELLDFIDKLNKDKNVHGIMVQMPLPSHIDINKVQNAVVPEKDIDGLCDLNAGLLFHGKDALFSCTPYGVMELLKRYNIEISGRHAVVVGRSNLVGKPMSIMLTNAGATVTLCHSKTKNLEKYTKDADILVVTVGSPRLITADMVSEGATVIDVGITRLDTGLCGDVDYEEVSKKALYITPVPGGVGPMTVAMLGMNVLKAYKMQRDK